MGQIDTHGIVQRMEEVGHKHQRSGRWPDWDDVAHMFEDSGQPDAMLRNVWNRLFPANRSTQRRERRPNAKPGARKGWLK